MIETFQINDSSKRNLEYEQGSLSNMIDAKEQKEEESSVDLELVKTQ